MILDMHPGADVTTIEACLSLFVYRQVMRVILPKTDSDIVQQIDDLLNEDAAPTTQQEIPADIHLLETEVFKIPKIVCMPEVQIVQDRNTSVWKPLDTPTDVHRRIVVTEEEDWPTTFRDLRQKIESKRKAPLTPEKPVKPKPSTSRSVMPSRKRKHLSERTPEEQAADNLARHKLIKLKTAEDLAALSHLSMKRSMPSDVPLDSPFLHSDLWMITFHSKQCGREIADAHVHLSEHRFMEHLSMQPAKDLINETYFIGKAPHQFEYRFKIGQSPLESDVKRFISEVKACHFFSFDSESKGNLKRPDRTCNHLFCSMSCPKTGTTFLFRGALDIPKLIVKCLEEYAIAKI